MSVNLYFKLTSLSIKMLPILNLFRHPIVYLKDVNPKHLELLLSYMYKGEINVLQNDLGPLIETAKGLQIKVRSMINGLCYYASI